MKEINMHLQELDSNCLLLREVKGLEMQRSPIFSGGSASSPSAGTANGTEASPHIVQFYGAVREGDGVAMAVEYMAGGSLENWIADRHALPEPWLANIAWQVSNWPLQCSAALAMSFTAVK
jgi:serine/threonine protein kinase